MADIDHTIAYWRRRGVRMVDVATALHCTRNWSAVRVRMLHWATNESGRKGT